MLSILGKQSFYLCWVHKQVDFALFLSGSVSPKLLAKGNVRCCLGEHFKYLGFWRDRVRMALGCMLV